MLKALPDNLPYEEWIDYIFDRPITTDLWDDRYWNDEAIPALTLSHVTRLFTEPSFLIPRFTDNEIDRGLQLILRPDISSHLRLLTNAELPWSDRNACFTAMFTLYRDLMAPVYQDFLGHLDRGPHNPDRPSRYSCYMWWDDIPIHANMTCPDALPINESVLNLFEKILQLHSEACLESALHGLGHWHMELPIPTELIIENFLRRRSDISPQLRAYAKQAAKGNVL